MINKSRISLQLSSSLNLPENIWAKYGNITQHIRYGLTPLPSGHCSLRSHLLYAGNMIGLIVL